MPDPRPAGTWSRECTPAQPSLEPPNPPGPVLGHHPALGVPALAPASAAPSSSSGIYLLTVGVGVLPLLPFIFKLIYLYFGFLTHPHPLPGGNQNQKSPRYHLYQLNKILPQRGKSSSSSRTQSRFSFPRSHSHRGGKLRFSSFFPNHGWFQAPQAQSQAWSSQNGGAER